MRSGSSGRNEEMNRKLFLYALPAVLITAGCGRTVSGDDWLFRLDGVTVTVSDAGAYWDSLSPSVQAGFISGGNPLGDFILAYSRKVLVERELERLGIPGNPGIEYRVDAWTRLHAFRSARNSLRLLAESSLTASDDAYYLDHLGTTVWYTIRDAGSTPGRRGPSVLSEIDPSLGLVLAGLSPRESAVLDDGSTVTLDSLLTTEPGLVSAMIPDSSNTLRYGRNMMADQRALAAADRIRDDYFATTDVEFRTDAFADFARIVSDGLDPSSSDTLVVAGTEVWTAGRMVEEIRCEAEIRPVMPSDAAWLASFAEVILYRESLAREIERIDPAAADSIIHSAGSYRMRLAADTLYRMFVTDSIRITDAMLDSAYAAAPPVIPEMRTFLCVSLRDSSELHTFKNLLDQGRTTAIVSGFDGIPFLAGSSGDSHLTRALLVGEVPGGLGDALFATSDTSTWFGPAPYPRFGIWVAFKLDSVMPARPATLEEANDELRSVITSAREQIRFESWMRGLEQTYGLEIDEKLMTLLPPDPSDWSEL